MGLEGQGSKTTDSEAGRAAVWPAVVGVGRYLLCLTVAVQAMLNTGSINFAFVQAINMYC